MRLICCVLTLLFLSQTLWADIYADMVVAKDGSGDYISISEAVEDLPYYNYQRIVVLVKNGVYNEKIRLECDYITIRGESRDSTIIQYAQLREDWQQKKDHIGPAVINIHADDIILDNLTIRNTQPKIGPHAFAILGKGTRTIIVNCNVTSNGGDTVSLWNHKTGMYYHHNCYFEGAVDFVCPRGWCYISNSIFNELKNTAAIWHAAPGNQKQKMVLKACRFLGLDSFYLARHHYDAQFYFIGCEFSSFLRDKNIERVRYPNRPEKNRPYLYGDRYYFYHCKREGGNYPWFADNLNVASLGPDTIDPEWTFDGQWNPIDTANLYLDKVEYEGDCMYLWFDEIVMPVGDLKVVSAFGKLYSYASGAGSERLKLMRDSEEVLGDMQGKVYVCSGNVQSVKATVKAKYLFSSDDTGVLQVTIERDNELTDRR